MQILSVQQIEKALAEELVTQVGVVKVVRHIWSAILDNRVCPYCRDRDGLVMSTDNSDYYTFMPPAHSSCRCLWISVVDTDPNIPDVTWKKPAHSLVKEFAPKLVGLPAKKFIKDRIVPILIIKKPEDSELEI